MLSLEESVGSLFWVLRFSLGCEKLEGSRR